jgi:hypothetical protein
MFPPSGTLNVNGGPILGHKAPNYREEAILFFVPTPLFLRERY